MTASVQVVRPHNSTGIRTFVEAHIGQSVLRCYQCGKCTAGCPVAYTMDLTPRQVMRALQMGVEDELEKSTTMWLCLNCLTCTARCPRELNISGVMEALRLATMKRKAEPSQKRYRLFHELFITSFQFSGRIYELGLGMAYNLLSGQFFNMASVIPGLLRRGKIAFMPHINEGAELQNIFRRIDRLEKKQPVKAICG